MSAIRPAAVAGTFYPAEPAELRRTLAGLFAGHFRPPAGPPA